MNKLLTSFAAVSLLTTLAVSPAVAGVNAATSSVRVIVPAPGSSVAPGGLESNVYVNVFTERTNFVLPDTVAVDVTEPGSYGRGDVLPATTSTIGTGTPVNSYYIFTDKVGDAGSQLFNATLTFDEPVLGVMVRGATFTQSQAVFGLPGITYPVNGGGLELGGCDNGFGGDCVTFTAPSTLSIKFTTWNITDSIRVITQSSISVAIDIKPGSDPNCVNNNDHGVIPVAIFGSAAFDASLVDPASVKLEGMAVKVVGKSDKLLASLEDVNGDGYMDMVVKIHDVDGAFTNGSTTATLTGNLVDGRPLSGTDTICIVP